jgi:hypothetical protein
LWYDTFDSICRAIEADPSNPHLRKQRESLLKSEGVLSASETSPDADGSQSDLFLILNSRSPTVDTQERQ